jgi:acyl-CoA oxidase
MAYGTMLFIRAGLVHRSGWAAAKAATIATRYSCVRKQGSISGTGPETALIE